MLLIILMWFVVSIVVAAAAYARGRRFGSWFLSALLLSPLIAGLLVALLPDLYRREELEERRRLAAADQAVMPANRP